VKILFLSDINLFSDNRESVIAQLGAIKNAAQPHAVVVVGDLVATYLAKESCSMLRGIFDIQPIALVMGNYSLWLSGGTALGLNPEDIIEKFWRPAARTNQIILLDEGNFDLGDVIVTGGYGHFDFGFATPNLRIGDALVSREDYERGITSGGVLVSNDPRMLACARGTEREAKRQAQGIGRRLDAAIATGKPVLEVTHTVPFSELNLNSKSPKDDGSHPSAYSGNSLVGEVIKPRASRIDLLVCAHACAAVHEEIVQGVRSVNLGSASDRIQGILYETETKQVASV
jgi:hypothetical protein